MPENPNKFKLAILRHPDNDPMVAIVSGRIRGLAESVDRQSFVREKLQQAISSWLATEDELHDRFARFDDLEYSSVCG